MRVKIRDHVTVRARPTVVRLEHLEDEASQWITESYYRTEQVDANFHALRHALNQEHGAGAFVIGHYGSGKSHFLGYVIRQLSAGAFGTTLRPRVVALSLVNFRAELKLENIVEEALGIRGDEDDRRLRWARLDSSTGTVLVIDELSEFLRSKPSRQSFTEDVRFLQFMGEWAHGSKFWIIAAMQEQIERTGELESSVYRKIKDRYPLRLLLTTQHVRDLLAESILEKGPEYPEQVSRVIGDIKEALPEALVDFDALGRLYPIHPTTIEMLEEVRELFSQTRGVVDYTLCQLLGNPARSIEPFLDRDWGELLTPDSIVDHFLDLFEVQPEFLALAQKFLPFYRQEIPRLFPTEAQSTLAWRLLKLLMLVEISPLRQAMTSAESAEWLLFRATKIAPAKNQEILSKMLSRLVNDGRYIKEDHGRYRIDLEDDSKARLAKLVEQHIDDIEELSPDALSDILIGSLGKDDFNPFTLPRDRWQPRKLRWCQHERSYSVFLGNAQPEEIQGASRTSGLCIRLPWGQAKAAPGMTTLVPAEIKIDDDLRELAALLIVSEQVLSDSLRQLLRLKIDDKRGHFAEQVRSAYLDSELFSASGNRETPRRIRPTPDLKTWLNEYGLWLLKGQFPSFERFAPGCGPLPKEAYTRFMQIASEHDIGDDDSDEYVKLIREAYLVPMGLMEREGWYYRVAKNLDKNELVQLVMPLIPNQPAPSIVYTQLSEPVYGLVPDQIHALLIFLVLQGEIDLMKGKSSYRDLYPTLPLPISYDRIVIGSGLDVEHLKALETLGSALRINHPKQWTVTAQRTMVSRLIGSGQTLGTRLTTVNARLKNSDPECGLVKRIDAHLQAWRTLSSVTNELRGFEAFLFEIGSAARFASEIKELSATPERLNQIMGELKRFSHLLGDSGVRGWPEPTVLTKISAVGPQPKLDDLATLEAWLAHAKSAYETYCIAYREAHDRWWRSINERDIWNWRPPVVAASRHLGLNEELEELNRLRQKASEERCRTLSDLDFRPSCMCGFDGKGARIEDLLDSCEQIRELITTNLTSYFRQSSVREKVSEWKAQGLELQPGLVAYLDGQQAVPEIKDVAAFDQHAAGLELVGDVATQPFLEIFTQRVWEKQALLEELGKEINRTPGQRLRFVDAHHEAMPEAVMLWCVEQSLQTATPLPDGINVNGNETITSHIRPEWIGRAALRRLEFLNLGERIENAILKFLLDGAVRCPADAEVSPLMRATLEILDPAVADTATKLTAKARNLYLNHDRLVHLSRDRWLKRLDDLAHSPVSWDETALLDILKETIDHQWLVVDCLGIPVLDALLPVIDENLCHWQRHKLSFAMVSTKTTTDAWYTTLANNEIAKHFEKVNAIDQLIHERRVTFADFERLAAVELGVALRRVASRLKRDEKLLIFADHGFRMGRDGSGLEHGGSSTLERLVPVIEMVPRQ